MENTDQLDKLTSYNVFDEIHGLRERILYFSKYEHLYDGFALWTSLTFHFRSEYGEYFYHLGNFLSVLVVLRDTHGLRRLFGRSHTKLPR